jgi:multidrug efflux pump subunit AcrB
MSSTSKSTDTSRKTFFQRFGLFFYDRAKTTFTVWLALMVFGVLSYTVFLQRQGFPNVDVPISVANGTYFVNDKTKVDTDIVKPFSELAVKQADVKTVTSSAGANFFSIVVEYKDGTKATAGSRELQASITRAGFVPAKATLEYMPVNASKFSNQYDVMLSLRVAPDTTTESLSTLAPRIAEGFSGTSGISSVKVLDPFKTGTSPVTGKQVTLQQTFDRVGERANDTSTFYPAIELGIIAKPGTDAIHLEKTINTRIGELEARVENKGVHIAVSAGVAENIQTQINNLQKNLIEGLVIVVIISLLLISWRAGLATALSMASVLLITIGVLYAVGLTLNTITLFALVLCLGLIVDDTTIMAEAIDAGKHHDGTQREIVAAAMKRVARASTAGTLVTMLAFAPMLFISGILGSFIRVLPITIIISLAVSLLISLTFIPFLSRFLLLSRKAKRAESRNPIVKAEGWLSSGLASMIRVGEHNRRKGVWIGLGGILISFVFLIGSGQFFSKLKFDIFPPSKDSNALMMTITYTQGTSVAKADAIASQADQVLAGVLGNNLRGEAYLDSGNSTGATAKIDLVDYTHRDVKSPALVQKLNDAFASFSAAKVKVSQSDVGPPKDDLPFRVQIYGNAADSSRLAHDMATFLKGHPVKRTNGTTATIARSEVHGDTDFITRSNASQLVQVEAGFNADDTSALVSLAQKVVEDQFTSAKLGTYGLTKQDVKFDFGNETNNQDSFKSMLFAFPILLIVMYILLALQFGSLLQPLLIFTAIPFSFFGVAAGLYFTNNSLSFFVMIGFFALIGIAVNNTILLTDFANQARKAGNGHFESMALAVKARFRPLITTSLTSVLALIPLALSDPFWESLAFTLIFGLLSSTFLVVVAFPYFYLAAELLRSKFSRRKALSWLAGLIVIIVVLSIVKSTLIPVGLGVYVGAMISKWLQGKFVKHLRRK